MRGLFFKIFVVFWIAQSLIFVISTALIVRHHFESPDVVFDTLDSSLLNDGIGAAVAFESGVCAAVQTYGVSIGQMIALTSATGEVLCNPSAIATEGTTDGPPMRINGNQVGQQYVWKVPISLLASGKQYVFLLS